MRLIRLELVAVFHPDSLSTSITSKVFSRGFPDGMQVDRLLQHRERELILGDGTSPQATIRGCLEESLSTWGFRTRVREDSF